eukprot:TRINITY_DN9177_c0_g1_i1.p1 TRINITY_DN9177_c0_g1~~TRINITY_DN9177_c0_g1_i1.p1  ORF type:complete len:328 (+),score=28.82 TRINITY_DN9177_c0_g1_i1:249-1232(+)
MTRVDFAIVTNKNNEITVLDAFSTPANSGFAPPLSDTDPTIGGVNNINISSGYQSDQYTQFSFQKLLDTGDIKGDWKIVPGNMRLVWAHGNIKGASPNTFGYHGEFRGELLINLFNGSSSNVVSNSDTFRQWHGGIMIFSYTICMTFGAFVARYLKNYFWWFPLHILLQVTGVTGSLVGFGIAVYMTQGSHFSYVHTWVGFGCLCMGLLAPILGWLADLLWNPSREKTPWWPDKFHWWTARITILAAYVSIILGLLLYGAPIPVVIMYGGVVGYLLFIYVVLEIYKLRVGNVVEGGHGHGAVEPNQASDILNKFRKKSAISLANQTI